MERVVRAILGLRVAMVLVTEVTARQYIDAIEHINKIEEILGINSGKMVAFTNEELKDKVE